MVRTVFLPVVENILVGKIPCALHKGMLQAGVLKQFTASDLCSIDRCS